MGATILPTQPEPPAPDDNSVIARLTRLEARALAAETRLAALEDVPAYLPRLALATPQGRLRDAG